MAILSILTSPVINRLFDHVLVDPAFPARVPFILSNDVSKSFAHEVKLALRKIPSHIKAILADNEEKVVAVKRLANEFPGIKGVRPRGWNRGTWIEAEGFYGRPEGEIVVAEEYYDRVQKRYIKNDNIGRVLRHEMGHALFYILRDYYEDNFWRAYEKDLCVLGANERKKIELLLTGRYSWSSRSFCRNVCCTTWRWGQI